MAKNVLPQMAAQAENASQAWPSDVEGGPAELLAAAA
jgi:hypothetical protein